MKLITFALVFMLLVVANSLAKGLEITEIDVNVDYDEAYTYRLENRARINSADVSVANNSKINVDILPGSNLTFTIRVENTFSGEEPEIKGVSVTTTIEDIDDGADLEQESIEFNFEPGDDERFDVKFGVPLDVNAGTYNVVIEAEGEERNDTSYKAELKLRLEVKKQSHDIRITKVLLSPSILECNRKAKLIAEITNVGSNPENQIALEFKASSIGVNSADRDIFLESSDEAADEEKTYAKALNIEIPSFFKSGAYQILINLYWKNFVLFDQKLVDLIVRDCSPSSTDENEINQEVKNETRFIIPTQPKDEAKEQTQNKGIVTATEEVSVFKSLLESPILLSVSLGAFFILLVGLFIVYEYVRISIYNR